MSYQITMMRGNSDYVVDPQMLTHSIVHYFDFIFLLCLKINLYF